MPFHDTKNTNIDLSITKSCAMTCTLTKAQINNPFQHYCLRVVVKGRAFYTLDNKTFEISENQFLLTNAHQDGFGIVDSNDEVIQFCVHLTTELISDVYTTLNFNNGEPDQSLFKLQQFRLFENTHALNGCSPLSKYLLATVDHINSGETIDFCEESLLKLAEQIIYHEQGMQSALARLDSVKTATRIELMRRLLLGKEFMDASFVMNPKIADVARQAMMSEYFFYRTFKLAFHCSPYQYMLNRRIESAKELLIANRLNISEIAASTGFPDLSTFSKAFKRKVGVSPSSGVNLFQDETKVRDIL